MSVVRFGRVLQTARSVDHSLVAKVVLPNCRTFLSSVKGTIPFFNNLDHGRLSEAPGAMVVLGYTDQRRFVGRTKTRLPYKKPLSFDYSGDLENLKPLEPTTFQYKFKDVPELKSAPDAVKKLGSLEFADKFAKKDHRYRELMTRIDQSLDGETEEEKKIARWTIGIRTMIQHVMKFRKDKRSKSQLVETIQARKKHLKNLRKLDFERFAWLLNELRIRYVPIPRYNKKPTRRHRRKSAVMKQARQLRGMKMNDFKERLQTEKANFLLEKETVLAEIRNDLLEVGLNPEKVFAEFRKSLEPPKERPLSKSHKRVLRLYAEALALGKVIPKPMMSPRR